jgi:glycosyltransferase involved in cell wall biosynthesis
LSRSVGGLAPRVSVVIPTYNRAKYIGQAIASAFGQSYRDLEVIVVDDGSTDSTETVLKSFIDPRLVVIRQENAGRSRARNVAINAARGEYITFLDSDDYYLPSKVDLQVSFLDANPVFGMAYTSAACIDDDGRSLNYTYRASLSGWVYPAIAFFIPHTITLPTVMVRREVLSAIGPFDEAMERFEDTDMWRRISKRTPIAGIDHVTCHIRTHAGNRLEGLDPTVIARSIDYYVTKILADDVDIDPAVLKAGARRLFEHYGYEMMRLPEFAATGKKLLKKG